MVLKSLQELGNELNRFYYSELVSFVLGLSLNRYYADGTLSWVSHKNTRHSLLLRLLTR